MFAKAVFGDVAIVEAFPTPFLGVLMPEQTFGTAQILRGKKFDWMYEHVVEAGRLAELMAFVGWDAPELLQSMQTERDHEKRAGIHMSADCGMRSSRKGRSCWQRGKRVDLAAAN